MPNSLRRSLGAVLIAAAAACSGSPDQATVSSDLEQDLAKAGGTDVQLAGSSGNRVDIVSASERVESPTPAPKAKSVSRAPSVKRGTTAVAMPGRCLSIMQDAKLQPSCRRKAALSASQK